MAVSDWDLLTRLAVGLGVAFVFGFERELRGSAAGDRTFALVGLGATVITAVTASSSPQAVAGVVTGVGFIGAGVIFHSDGGGVKGITTAATIFATAATGVMIGYGHLFFGVVNAFAVLLILELRHIPILRLLDARRYKNRFTPDGELVVKHAADNLRGATDDRPTKPTDE